MDVTILGSGCAKCRRLEDAARAAIQQLGVDATVTHVTDAGEIASWGVIATPALAVDDEVVLAGRVPSVDDLAAILGDR